MKLVLNELHLYEYSNLNPVKINITDLDNPNMFDGIQCRNSGQENDEINEYEEDQDVIQNDDAYDNINDGDQLTCEEDDMIYKGTLTGCHFVATKMNYMHIQKKRGNKKVRSIPKRNLNTNIIVHSMQQCDDELTEEPVCLVCEKWFKSEKKKDAHECKGARSSNNLLVFALKYAKGLIDEGKIDYLDTAACQRPSTIMVDLDDEVLQYHVPQQFGARWARHPTQGHIYMEGSI